MVEYWLVHYTNPSPVAGCSLCGNTGIIDTRGAVSPAGFPAGRLIFCICPNGQARRHALPEGHEVTQDQLAVDLMACRLKGN